MALLKPEAWEYKTSQNKREEKKEKKRCKGAL